MYFIVDEYVIIVIRMNNSAVSPQIGVLLMLGITVGFVSMGSFYLVSTVDDVGDSPIQATPTVEVSDTSVEVSMLRSEGASKFIVKQSGHGVMYSTKSETWTRTFDKRSGELVIIGIDENSSAEQILMKEYILSDDLSFSSPSVVAIGNGHFIEISSSQLLNYNFHPEVQGPPEVDYIDDGTNDLPVVDGRGHLLVTNEAGDMEKLIHSSDSESPKKTKSIIGVFNWKSYGSIFYAGQDGKIYSVGSSGSPTSVANPSNGVDGIVDSGDIDNDNNDELLFVDSSQQLRYINQDSSISALSGIQVGSNNGLGVNSGAVDFDGDGIVRIPVVNGGNDIVLVGDSEPDVTISGVNAMKAPIATVDGDGDGKEEIFYTDKDSGKIKFVDNVLSTPSTSFLLDKDGNKVSGDD